MNKIAKELNPNKYLQSPTKNLLLTTKNLLLKSYEEKIWNNLVGKAMVE